MNSYYDCMPYIALEAITIESLNMILANEEAQTRPVSQSLLISSFERPLSSWVQRSVAMTTSQGNGYGTQSIN